MKERIIVIPSFLDLARTSAYHGEPVYNTRFFTPAELAQESLMRSGNLSKKEFISINEELSYYPDIVNSISYFGKDRIARLSDLKRVNATIDSIRKLVVKDESTQIREKLSKGRFKDKNEALINVYERYIEKLKENNKIDTIGLIREAIDNSFVLKSEIAYLKEYPLQPLEIELIKTLSDGKCQEISLFDLFGTEKKKIHIDSYRNCYGSSNEVASIIDDIFRNKEVDQCIAACADYGTYAQIFFDYAMQYDLPICFGNGLPVIDSYPGKFFRQYQLWRNEGNFGWEPFLRMINSPYFDSDRLNSLIEGTNGFRFDEFWKRVSRLRLTDDRTRNEEIIHNFESSIKDFSSNDQLEKYVPGIKAVAEELALPMEKFLMKYCRIRKDHEFLFAFDESAKNMISNQIITMKNIGLVITDDVTDMILKRMTFRQPCKPGHLYVCPINKAASVLRKNLYVCGLSAVSYPGNPQENPLLLDCDLKDFENDSLTSAGIVRQKRKNLFDLIGLASSLNNEIYLSYPGLNVSELKRNNASSLLFEIYRMENGDDKTMDDFARTVKQISYFEPEVSVSRLVGEAYNRSQEILHEGNGSDNDEKTSLTLRKYSPSALNTYFTCKKQFFFKYLLGIQEPDDYHPYEVISAVEQGTLAHSLMEYLSDHWMEKDDYLKLCGIVFDEYMNITVPLIRENIDQKRDEFVNMMENGWNWDNEFKREVAFKEEDKDCIHKETGICIHGYPDRVELTEDGKAIIVDFKTEGKLGVHLKDDIDTCLQVIIYAYIVENAMGKKIDHCEYGIITCKYDDEIKKQLTEKLSEFKQSLEMGDFSIEPMTANEEKERCRYCKYGSICGKTVIEDEDN